MTMNLPCDHPGARNAYFQKFFNTFYPKKLIKVLIFFICVICGFKCFFTDSKHTFSYLFAYELESKPVWEADVLGPSLAETVLEIARDSYPEIDINHYLANLDTIIQDMKANLYGKQEPEQVINAMNTIIFHKFQFKYVQAGNLEYMSLNRVLDTKTGNCEGLSILYLCIAEGLHLPIYGVSVPEHIFVRYDDGKFRRNIETGYEGMAIPDSYYMNMPGKRISPVSVKKGYYLKNLTRNEVIANIYLNRSIIQKKKGNRAAALRDVNHAIGLHADDAVAYCNRGVIYEEMGNIEEAIYDYNKSILLNPDYAPAYYNRGSLYAAIEKLEQAIMDYNKALHLDPNSTLSYYNRGIAFKMIGRVDLSIEDLSKAISLDPEFSAAYAHRGMAYAESGEPEKAMEDFDRSLELDPGNADVYMKRAILHADLRHFDNTIEDIKVFLTFAPNNSFAYYIRAKAYRGKGDIKGAIRDYDKVIELNPRMAGVYFERGQVKDQMGKPDEALIDYTAYIELFPYNPLAYLHRGNSYKLLGNHEGALKDYLIYLKLNPNASDAEEINKQINELKEPLSKERM